MGLMKLSINRNSYIFADPKCLFMHGHSGLFKVRVKANKWRAVAAQTARCRSKVLSIQYVYYFRAYQKAVQRKKNHSLKIHEARSQASRQTTGYSV